MLHKVLFIKLALVRNNGAIVKTKHLKCHFHHKICDVVEIFMTCRKNVRVLLC